MKHLICLTLLLLTVQAHCQDLVPLWSGYMTTTTTNAASITAFETDSEGNVYYVGKTPYNTYFNYHPFGGTLIMSPVGNQDCFIVKISSDGTVLWGETFGGSGDDIGTDIAIDDFENVYITGTFEGTVDFDPGAGVDNHTAPSNHNQFIVKLDTAGNYIWTKTIEAPFAGSIHLLTTDSDGNVFTTGNFSTAAMDFDPSAAVFNLPYTSGSDMFVLKLDEDGNFMWAKAVGGTLHQLPRDLVTDNLNHVYICGDFMETVDFDPGTGTESHVSVGGRDLFLLKLNELGDFQWVHTAGGPSDDYAADVEIDPNDNVYFTGDFKGTVDFGSSGVPMMFTSYSAGNQDMFVQKLTSNGTSSWVKQIGGSAAERPKEIKIDDLNNVVIGGSFQGTTDFDPGVGVAQSTVFSADDDAFILILDSIGEYVLHASTYEAEDEFCSGIALGPDGSIYLAGNFDGYVDLSLGQGTDIYGTGSVVVKPYVAKYHRCSHSQSTDTVVTCDSYMWPLTGLTYSSSNIYSSVETDIFGCDSTVYLDLTINTVNIGVNQNDNTLTANESGASYQWIDCMSMQAISGETNQSFVATNNGSYAVVVDNGLCSDTSACTAIQGIGITELYDNPIRIYPNPASMTIQIDDNTFNEFAILTISGQRVLKGELQPNTPVDISVLPSGVYLVKLQHTHGATSATAMFMKE